METIKEEKETNKPKELKYRHEYKCRVNLLDIMALRSRIQAVMPRDSNAGENGIYTIKSLYFDNYMDKALQEKAIGINDREKFRIRYYGDDTSFIRLEKKLKRDGLCNKQSAIITREECEDIINGKRKSVFDTDNGLKRELYAKMQYQLLRPKNIVVYEREAFVYGPGNVRITFDTNIRGSDNIHEFFNSGLSTVKLYSLGILEIKWDEHIPGHIKDIVQNSAGGIISFSKYAAVRFM